MFNFKAQHFGHGNIDSLTRVIFTAKEMAPPGNHATNKSGQRPTEPNRHSRKFNDETDNPWYTSFAEPNDYFSPKKKSTRSKAYTSPLSFANEDEILQKLSQPKSTPLTRENLENLTALQEAESPPTDSRLNDPAFLAFMRKSKSRSPEKKKPDKKKSKDEDIHPLNLPPEELRRLSVRMAAKDEKRTSAQMDKDVEMSDADAQASMNGITSQPSTPGVSSAPGAFPSSEPQVNGDDREEEPKSPTPPPHRTQPVKVDPEACKAAGNKFFKAKDYDRAISEYSKGNLDCVLLT